MCINSKSYTNLKYARKDTKHMRKVLRKIEKELRKMETVMNNELGKLPDLKTQQLYIDGVLNNLLRSHPDIYGSLSSECKDGVLTVSIRSWL